MPETVFFLTRLRAGISSEEYEAWVQAVDYPRVREYTAILDYSVMRVESGLEGEAVPFDYIERVVVTDVAAYQRERLARPDREAFRQEIGRLIGVEHAFVARQVGTP